MIVIGGLGSIGGAIVGAVLVTALPQVLDHYADRLPLVAAPGGDGLQPADAARFLYGAAVVARPDLRARGRAGRARRAGSAATRNRHTQGEHRMSRSSASVAAGSLRACAAGAVAGCGSKGERLRRSRPAAAAGQDRPGRHRQDDHARRAHRPLRRLRPARQARSPRPTAVLEAAERATAASAAAQVKLVVKDHGYDPQKAVVQYRDLAPKVAGLQQLLGSPITAALLPTLKTDPMLSLPVRVAVVAAGQRLRHRDRRVLRHRADQRARLPRGQGQDQVGRQDRPRLLRGRVRRERPEGLQVLAEENGLTVVEQKIKPTDEDMTGQVAALKRAGVKAIAVTTGPKQMASLAGIAAAQGLNVPIVGNNPTFDPALMADPGREGAEGERVHRRLDLALHADGPRSRRSPTAYARRTRRRRRRRPCTFGYSQAPGHVRGAQQGVREQGPHPRGLVKAARQLSGLDTGGLIAGDAGLHEGRRAVDAHGLHLAAGRGPGGLKALPDTLESDEAKSYDVGAST